MVCVTMKIKPNLIEGGSKFPRARHQNFTLQDTKAGQENIETISSGVFSQNKPKFTKDFSTIYAAMTNVELYKDWLKIVLFLFLYQSLGALVSCYQLINKLMKQKRES